MIGNVSLGCEIYVRLYHRSPLIKAVIQKISNRIIIRCENQIKNVWSGNPVAIYLKRGQYGISWDSEISDFMVLGSGTIRSPGISIWENDPTTTNRFAESAKLSPFHMDRDFWEEILYSGWHRQAF